LIIFIYVNQGLLLKIVSTTAYSKLSIERKFQFLPSGVISFSHYRRAVAKPNNSNTFRYLSGFCKFLLRLFTLVRSNLVDQSSIHEPQPKLCKFWFISSVNSFIACSLFFDYRMNVRTLEYSTSNGEISVVIKPSGNPVERPTLLPKSNNPLIQKLLIFRVCSCV